MADTDITDIVEDPLDRFLGKLNSIPSHLTLCLQHIRKLDQRSQEVAKQLECAREEYLSLEEADEEKFQELKRLEEECCNIITEKVNLSSQLYDMVDDQIRNLDKELRENGAMLTTQGLTVNRNAFDTPSKSGSGRKKKHRSKKSNECDMISLTELLPETDMREEHEPLYCTCRQPAFGDMVGCENEECPIEWFHFSCVGLRSAPKGSWFCPQCSKS